MFAMDLEVEALRRDVLQVAVNFSNHRYLGPTGSEADTRIELKKRAFDFLIQKALERLAGERDKRRELDRQRHLLKQKLAAMKSGHWGLGAMLNGEEGEGGNLADLEAEIESIEQELGKFHTDKISLEESLEHIAEIFSHPRDWLDGEEISLRLDYRGFKAPNSSTATSREIKLTELFSCTGERRTVLLGRVASADIPAPSDVWEKAKIYL